MLENQHWTPKIFIVCISRPKREKTFIEIGMYFINNHYPLCCKDHTENVGIFELALK